jgi:hypothetical protein
MNDKEGLNLLDFLATGINKRDPVIHAVLSNESGEGAAANELEALLRFINYYTRTADVRNHKGYTLEMIAKLFAKLRRRLGEHDGTLLRRLLALTERKGDTIWGNALDIKHVIETYFEDITCFVAENTNEKSVLNNGDFEEEDAWILEGGAVYAYAARFSGKRGVYFDGVSGGTCTQELDTPLPSGNYTFHFFLKGKCGLVIQRADGKYWNANDQKFTGEVVLEWVDDETVNIFEKEDWEDAFCFIKIPGGIHNITFRFISVDGETASIDYARFFQKPLNPSYTLVIRYQGYTIADKPLHLAEGREDPLPGVGYEDESYFDHAFIIGPMGITHSAAFKSIIDLVRPQGIQVFTEFVERSIIEQEESL